jgi:putative phosphoesterase
MQKIMVISDTHDDRDAIRGVMRYLKNFKVDRVIHLGDYYDDADILENAGYPLTRVPGTWDTVYYPDPDVCNRKFLEVAGWRIFLTHTPESHYNDRADDIKPETILQGGGADIFLFGHTHIAEIRRRNGTVCINPGHMSSDESRGCPLTFALLEIEAEEMTVSIFQLPDAHPRIRKNYRKRDLR